MGAFRCIEALFFPHTCLHCGKSIANRKDALCADCARLLPKTEHAQFRGNMVEMLFDDSSLKKYLVRGGAFCYYELGSEYRKLIHACKYYRNPHVGVHLGRLAAEEFGKYDFFDSIDYIVPVPLHKKKRNAREYNQSTLICNGMAEVTGLTVDETHLFRVVNNPSQTQKSKEERMKNTEGIFTVVNPEDWKGKHILLVDDIITTGATLKACMHAMCKIRNIRVSVFALGLAHNPIIIEENGIN